MKNWFEVNKQGLAKILERKGKEFALFELIQNTWDEPGATSFPPALPTSGWPQFASRAYMRVLSFVSSL